MRVLILAENWPPRVGGIENYLTHIAAGLAERGHVVTVIVPKGHRAENLPGTIQQIQKRFFWPLRPAWLPLFVWLWRYARHEQPEIILCGKALFEGHLGYYFAKRLGIPYAVFTYAMEIETWAASRHRRALRRVLTHAHRVIYINDLTQQQLISLGVRENQLVKVQPGVDDRFLRKLQPELIAGTLRHYGLQQPYILSVGRLVPRKGFDVLIEAFSRLEQTRFAETQLVIVGSGPEQSRLQELAKQELIHRRVHFLSDVPDTHLPALYQGAAVFALTPHQLVTDYEGFGIVYLEAAASGLATVATDTGGAREAVQHTTTGLVVVPEAEAITAALSQLLQDSQLRQRLGAAGQARAEHSFRWANQVLILEKSLLSS